MTEKYSIDDERIAAFLDGRLTAQEAAAFRVELANADDDTLAVFADSARVLRELNGETSRTSSQSRVVELFRSKRNVLIITALAASAVFVMLKVPFSRDSTHGATQQYASALAVETRIPESLAWNATRGAGASLSVDEKALRAGALMTDLQLASIRKIPALSQLTVFSALVENVPAGLALSTTLRQLSNTGTGVFDEQQLASIETEALLLFDDARYNAGAYLEATRIATAARDENFFVRNPPQPLEALRDHRELDVNTQRQVQLLIQLIGTQPRAFDRIGEVATSVLRGG